MQPLKDRALSGVGQYLEKDCDYDLKCLASVVLTQYTTVTN